jgi:hypothetical protein
MKWFHHECAAKHDPKLQTLGATYGAEGLGIYWSLLEEIGQHSDTFHLKVSGISDEADQRFAQLTGGSHEADMNVFKSNLELEKVPRIPLKILARILFTTPKKLITVIDTCIEVGLFDSAKWRRYNLLYSPSFENRADDYTRRQQRKSDLQRSEPVAPPVKVRTPSEQGSELLRTLSANVLQEQTTEEEVDQMKSSEDTLLFAVDAEGTINLSTEPDDTEGSNGHFLIEPSPDDFKTYVRKCLSVLRRWNETRMNRFSWNPTDSELKKLFYGGEKEHKLRMCYQAYNLQGEQINYPELVLRAVKLMLKASQKHRIVNPFGWLWSCLHGNGDGTTPWVQLLTAEEEKSGSSSRRSGADTDLHPPESNTSPPHFRGGDRGVV